MEKNKLKTKPITKLVMKLAELSCSVWYYGRCKLWRQIMILITMCLTYVHNIQMS